MKVEVEESMNQKLRQTSGLHKGESLWWWVMHEVNALLNVALQARLACFEQFLLFSAHFGKDVGGLFGSGRLGHCQQCECKGSGLPEHTPSSTGTEK